MNYLLAAILANLSYAVSDIFNGYLSKRNSALKIAFWVAIFAAIIFLPVVFFFQDDLHKLTVSNIALAAGIGSLMELGYISFLLGMRKGSIILTGVIGGAFPAVSIIISLIFFNESISTGQAASIIIVMCGILLSSIPEKFSKIFSHVKTPALIYAFLAFLFWGIYFAVVRVPVERIGWFLPQYISNLVGIIICIAAALYIKEKVVFSKPKNSLLMAGVAVLGLGGTMLFSYAISRGPTAIIAPIAGSAPVVFAALAFLIFREKLSKVQMGGIALTLAGIISLTLLSS